MDSETEGPALTAERGGTHDPIVGRALDLALGAIFFVFCVLGIRYQHELLDFREWGDESETIVVAKMLASGQSLYSEIFNHHGPLTFLPGLLLESFGSFGVVAHRAYIAVLQMIALAALYFSPLFRTPLARRTYTMLAATVLLVYLPEVRGHMYKYQVLAGLALVVVLAQHILPIISDPASISKRTVIIGNALLGCLPFLAVTYVPVTALLFAASLRRESWAVALFGLAGGAAFGTAFLVAIGSIPGFLAYHIYLNAKVLPPFLGLQGWGEVLPTAFVSATLDLVQLARLAALLLSVSVLEGGRRGLPWRGALVALGLGSLLTRGAGFHALPYFYAMLVVPAVLFARLKDVASLRLPAIALGIICSVKVSMVIADDPVVEAVRGRKVPETTEFGVLARAITSKTDRIISYSFQNFQYLAANRLPASGHFFYLPWQKKYNEHPVLGVRMDACEQIARNRPKIMQIDKWKVWERFPWESYAGCVQGLLDEEYVQLGSKPYYLRRDLRAKMRADEAEERELLPSSRLGRDAPIPLKLVTRMDGPAKLRRLGVRFATHRRRVRGQAELRLWSPAGKKEIKRFSLAGVRDNRTRFFSVAKGVYASGDIRLLSGKGGLSTWESRPQSGQHLTCLIYVYDDGKVGFTHGCPPY